MSKFKKNPGGEVNRKTGTIFRKPGRQKVPTIYSGC
jgi:hypothetical protein